MIEKLNNLVKGYDDLSERMSDPTVIANIKEYTKLAKEHRRLNNIIPKVKINPMSIKLSNDIIY